MEHVCAAAVCWQSQETDVHIILRREKPPVGQYVYLSPILMALLRWAALARPLPSLGAAVLRLRPRDIDLRMRACLRHVAHIQRRRGCVSHSACRQHLLQSIEPACLPAERHAGPALLISSDLGAGWSSTTYSEGMHATQQSTPPTFALLHVHGCN